MGDSVERALEETVPILKTAQRLKLLSHAETSTIVRKRRDHEYAVLSHKATRANFLRYAAFERELSAALAKRAERRGLKKRKSQLVVGRSEARVNLVYSRAVRRFPGDSDLWLHYARHCVRSGSTRAAARVFAKAIGLCGGDEAIWLAACAYHFDTCGDASGARAIAQRALRALPESFAVWREYFRMEVCYLAKLISRRLAIGLPLASRKKRKVPKEKDRKPRKRRRGNGRIRKGVQAIQSDKYASAINAIPGKHGEMGNLGSEQPPPEKDETGSKASAEDNSGDNRDSVAGADELVADDDELNLPDAMPDGPEPLEKDISNARERNQAEPQASPIETERLTNEKGEQADAEERGSTDDSSEEEHNDIESESDDASSKDESPAPREAAAGANAEFAKKTQLSFWEGGVPMAVFSNACEKLTLTPVDMVDFWSIAASMPYIPPRLLEAISDALHAKFPNCLVCRLVKTQVPWYFKREEMRERISQHGENSKTGKGLDVAPFDVERERQTLAAEALEVFTMMKQALSTFDRTTQDDELAKCLLVLIGNFLDAATRTGQREKMDGAAATLRSFLEPKPPSDLRESVAAYLKNGESLSAEQIMAVLRSEASLSSEERSGLFDSLKRNVLVPFRDLEQDRALCAWISQEDDPNRVRDLGKELLSLPPFTVETVRGLIDAEIRIWKRLEDNGEAPASAKQDMLLRTRQYFRRATDVPRARRDIDLWLNFVDFERRVARDAKQATLVSWNAMKVLDQRSGELFTERLTLRNLAV